MTKLPILPNQKTCGSVGKCGYQRGGKHGEKGKCRTYRCSRCKRWVPWCFGASDEQPSRCDDCRTYSQEIVDEYSEETP